MQVLCRNDTKPFHLTLQSIVAGSERFLTVQIILPKEILEVVCILLNEVGQLYKTVFLRGDHAQLYKLRTEAY